MNQAMPKFEHTTEPPRSPIKALREALAEVPGEVSRSRCGCTWKRVEKFPWHGAVLHGDLLIRYCDWHEWYASLSPHQKRELSSQQRQVRREGRPPC